MAATTKHSKGPYDPESGRYGYCTQTVERVNGVLCSKHENCPLHS